MERRYHLDWLRVLLFGLLVLHHVAVGFVAWGEDIYRFTNDEVARDRRRRVASPRPLLSITRRFTRPRTRPEATTKGSAAVKEG